MKRFKLLRSRLGLCGACMSLIVVVFGLIGPFISPYAPSEFSPDQLMPPSMKHYWGTDEYGRDLFSRVIGGTPVTLSIAITTIFFGGTVGILWGLLAAYTRGIVANLLDRAVDVVMSFPEITLALLVLAVAGTGGKMPLIIAIAISFAPGFARVIRGATLPILNEDFILATKALGASHLRILAMHVLPNLVAPITVLTTIYLPFVIMLESSLSFLGLGVPPDVPTWGRIISDGKVYMQLAPWLTIFPGIAIVYTALSFNLLGDGLRDLLDPKSTARLYDR